MTGNPEESEQYKLLSEVMTEALRRIGFCTPLAGNAARGGNYLDMNRKSENFGGKNDED